MNTGHEIVINILYIQLNTKLLKIHTDFTYIIIKKKSGNPLSVPYCISSGKTKAA